jgi:DNA-directed RNA polymerase specialized sigma24 family protein
MKHTGAEKGRWELDRESFGILLRAFSHDQDSAGKIYLRLRRNIERFFEVRGIAQTDLAADSTLDRLARKLAEGERIADPPTYALGIARMIVLELRKSPVNRLAAELPETGSWDPGPEEEKKESGLECLDKCLDELSAEGRDVILGYYQGEKSEKIKNRQELATRLGIPPNALRNRAVRIRNKLETCVTGCLKG